MAPFEGGFGVLGRSFTMAERGIPSGDRTTAPGRAGTLGRVRMRSGGTVMTLDGWIT
jgi:hypothetical protein